MGIFDSYNSIGKNNIKATSSDFINMVGEKGIRDIVIKVFLGGNVRDITETITQRRLINSYAAMLDLYLNSISEHAQTTEEFAQYVADDLIHSKGAAKMLDLWLLGLTKKGFDNIVRSEEHIADYQYTFSSSVDNAVQDLENIYGKLYGTIEINERSLNLDWKILSLMFIAVGAQTLSIRGSAKSMNGKMFERLVLCCLLSVFGFEYLHKAPEVTDRAKRLFWLSNMDENERETDATAVYNGLAVSIDIGFIGRGNPEITLDKVTRFNAYKQIGGIPHDMSTIIIVDTVGENSDLFNKAERVNGHVLQMKHEDWTVQFSRILCWIFDIDHILNRMQINDLGQYFKSELDRIDINKFIKKHAD